MSVGDFNSCVSQTTAKTWMPSEVEQTTETNQGTKNQGRKWKSEIPSLRATSWVYSRSNNASH